MIDEDFKLYLIEVNVNPCLEIKSPVTSMIIPTMLDNTFRIAIDPMFQLVNTNYGKKNICIETPLMIKYELIYDSRMKDLERLDKHINTTVEEDEEGETD